MTNSYRHKDGKYLCPFCLINEGVEGDYPYSKQKDIVYKDPFVMCLIASHWWTNNKAHLLVIPAAHYENIYELPNDIGYKIQDLLKKSSIALKKVYKCSGITIIQHNEPDGNQDVFHLHFHIFPRYKGDSFYKNINTNYLSAPSDRTIYAEKLKAFFSENV